MRQDFDALAAVGPAEPVRRIETPGETPPADVEMPLRLVVRASTTHHRATAPAPPWR